MKDVYIPHCHMTKLARKLQAKCEVMLTIDKFPLHTNNINLDRLSEKCNNRQYWFASFSRDGSCSTLVFEN